MLDSRKAEASEAPERRCSCRRSSCQGRCCSTSSSARLWRQVSGASLACRHVQRRFSRHRRRRAGDWRGACDQHPEQCRVRSADLSVRHDPCGCSGRLLQLLQHVARAELNYLCLASQSKLEPTVFPFSPQHMSTEMFQNKALWIPTNGLAANGSSELSALPILCSSITHSA